MTEHIGSLAVIVHNAIDSFIEKQILSDNEKLDLCYNALLTNMCTFLSNMIINGGYTKKAAIEKCEHDIRVTVEKFLIDLRPN
jgi:hypothetical protein